MPRLPTARPSPRRDRPLARACAAGAASAALHALVLAALGAAGALEVPAGDGAAPVALARIEPAAWAANRAVAGEESPRLESPARPTPPVPAPAAGVPIPAGRVVEVAPSQDSRRPARARFLAERDNTVAEDVQHRGAVQRPGPVAARPTAGAAGTQGIPLPGEEGTADEAAPGREGARGREEDAATRIAAARLALVAGGDRPASPVPAAGARGDGGARRAGRFDPRVLPVGDLFQGVSGGSPSAERLPGVREGDATVLNTRAFKYADFFRRLGEAIRAEWDPNRAWNALDPQDQIFGRSARVVLVDIVLEPGGNLREARVARSSGLEFFDREALRAIDAAAPFPNPPRGLVGAEGLIVVERYGLRFEWPEHAILDRLLPSGRP
jgi:TonB family protein